ncbi:hypothetical protein, partial [Burkholderia vietnamiensis]|uniref:hypothetical protein n=1 Tax=Burkholderia vietnamiensis TaxID=60552 RepID=UPI001ABAD67A
MSWSPNSTRTDKEIYNRHCATPKPAESVTFPKSAVTFAEIRSDERSAVAQRAGFALNQRDVMAPVVEGHVPLEAAFVACDLLGVGDDAEI